MTNVAFDSTPWQIAGGWLLFADMILTALLFANWEKAGQIRLGLRKDRR